MDKRLALITGGTSGIGLAAAKALAGEYNVGLVYGEDENKARSVLSDLTRDFPSTRFEIYKGPLTDSQSVSRLLAGIQQDFSIAPSVVIQAGAGMPIDFVATMKIDTLRRAVHESAVVGQTIFNLVIPGMLNVGFGRLISIGSISARMAAPGLAAYAAAKSALVTQTLQLARKINQRGITINSISPGIIETPRTESLIQTFTGPKELRAEIPLGFVGQPGEVAELIKFLCSESGEKIHGNDIPFDGGRSLGRGRSH